MAAPWPRAARRLGLLLPLLALGALVRRHTELGNGLLRWALGLFVLAAVVWWTGRRAPAEPGQGGSGRWSALPVRIVVGVLSLAVAVGAVVDVYRIGDSGAKAAWHDAYSKTATGSEGGS
ncbi:hypothetical protein [Streptomyces sp. NPDC002676]